MGEELDHGNKLIVRIGEKVCGTSDRIQEPRLTLNADGSSRRSD